MKGSESIERYLEAKRRRIAGADVFGAGLIDADMRGVMLSWAILNNANLRWANLVNIWTIPDQLIRTSSLTSPARPDSTSIDQLNPPRTDDTDVEHEN